MQGKNAHEFQLMIKVHIAFKILRQGGLNTLSIITHKTKTRIMHTKRESKGIPQSTEQKKLLFITMFTMMNRKLLVRLQRITWQLGCPAAMWELYHGLNRLLHSRYDWK